MDRMVTERVKALERERTEIRRRQEQVIDLMSTVGDQWWKFYGLFTAFVEIDRLFVLEREMRCASIEALRMLAALTNQEVLLTARIYSLNHGSFRADCGNWNQPMSAYE